MNWLDPESWETWWRKPLSRGLFLKTLTLAGALLAWPGRGVRRALAQNRHSLPPRPRRDVATDCPLAAVTGPDPAACTVKAVAALGGISRFVKSGDVVVVKPNIGWDRTPEQAANTHPAVVAALVRMCREAGAKTVKVFDRTCNDARRTYRNSGIQEAARQAGAVVSFVSDWKFFPGQFPDQSLMQDWPVYRDAVECDCFINVPVAKHHGLTRLSLSMKNLMGVCGGSRGQMHWDIDRKLAELTAFIRPDLTVIDASRMLLRHGPTGGRLEDVEERRTILASADPVLADAFAATLFDLAPADIGHIAAAAQQGLGTLNVKQPGIRRLTL